MWNRIKENSIVLFIILATVIAAVLLQRFSFQSYSRYASDTLHYEKAVVVEVSDESLEYDEGLEIYLGTQELKVEMLDSEEEGSIIDVTNYLTQTHNCIGRGKGVKAIAGLAYSLFMIIYLVLPAVFSGYSPIWMSILCGILSTAVTLLLLNGQSEKTWAAILSTTVGVICSLLLFLIMSHLVHIDGFSSSEAEGLVLINQETGLKIKDVLFAGVLISSLGAIMDTGMSIVSALYEVYTHNPGLGTKELFLSGIEMGKDMIGTMTNTLILAFTGSAFITLLVFLSYQVQADQLFNSNYLTIEIAQGICGTFGIVLTVPVASAVTAAFLARKKNA